MGVLAEKKDRILTLTIDRPKAMNSLDPETRGRLAEHFEEFHDDDDLWVAVLTGAGEKSFCAGADIKKTIGASLDQTVWARRKPFLKGRDLYSILGNLTKPVVAAVNGYALGGGLELALCCDIRVASETATFRLPGAEYGLVVAAATMPRLVGASKAKEWIYTARKFEAEEALATGLVSSLHAPAELLPAALEMAEVIAGHSQSSVRESKRVIDLATLSAEASAAESEANSRLRGSEEQTARFRDATRKVTGR